MKKFFGVLVVVLLMLTCAGISCAETESTTDWQVSIFLSNGYVDTAKVDNGALLMSDISREWFFIAAHSFNIDLDKRIIEVELCDLGYIKNIDDVAAPALGINKAVKLSVSLLSWHTVYVTESDKDGKYYEALYGLVSSDGGETYTYKVIFPKHEVQE